MHIKRVDVVGQKKILIFTVITILDGRKSYYILKKVTRQIFLVLEVPYKNLNKVYKAEINVSCTIIFTLLNLMKTQGEAS